MTDWRARAACSDVPTAVFFPDATRGGRSGPDYRSARTVCAGCDVADDCLLCALRVSDYYDQWGMFGGLTPGERRVMRRMMRARAVAS